MVANYGLGLWLTFLVADGPRPRLRSAVLILGVTLNLVALVYYKYSDFLLRNLNLTLRAHFHLPHLVLPLGISFFTFTQIAYLVDCYREKARVYRWVDYGLFITFFPHLLAGPIIHHSEMMPQFEERSNKTINFQNIARGLFIFAIGAVKKLRIADAIATWVGPGFDSHNGPITFIPAWIATISYTLQIYFDFSGYTDMAIGSALIFNIQLPENFNSPYHASNIQDFWRRWHMTLSRWLRDYLYIPLGGSRGSKTETYRNMIVTFLLGGLWHGASWTFVAWGAMHGIGSAIHRAWQGTGRKLNRVPATLLTLLFVHCAWVFFRASSFASAARMFRGLAGFNGLGAWDHAARVPVPLILVAILIAACPKNTFRMLETFRPTLGRFAYGCLMIAIAFYSLLSSHKEFLYFNF